MPRVEIVDAFSAGYAISTLDGETLARWLIEWTERLDPSPAFPCWAVIWPLPVGNSGFDWVVDTRIITRRIELIAPGLAGFVDGLRRWRGQIKAAGYAPDPAQLAAVDRLIIDLIGRAR